MLINRKRKNKSFNTFVETIAFLIFFFPLFNNAIIPQSNGALIAIYLLQVASVVAIFLRSEKRKITKKDLLAPLFTICFVAITLINNAYILNGQRVGLYISQIFYLTSATVLSFRKINTRSLLAALNILYLEHMIVSAIVLALPKLYSTAILPTICKYEKPCHARSNFLEGLNPGLSKHYTTNGIILSFSSVYYFICAYKTKNAKNIALFIISIALLLSVGKRTHLAVSILVMIIYYFKAGGAKISQKIKKIVIGALLAIAAVIGYLIAAAYIPNLAITVNRFQQFSQSDDVTNGRELLWSLAINNWKENPVIGKGWGSYSFDSNKYKNIYGGGYIEAHNDYLQMLAEMGLIGFIVYSAIITTLIRSKSKELNNNSDPYSAFAYLYMVYFCLYGLTGHPLHTTLTFGLLAIVSFIKNNSEKKQ